MLMLVGMFSFSFLVATFITISFFTMQETGSWSESINLLAKQSKSIRFFVVLRCSLRLRSILGPCRTARSLGGSCRVSRQPITHCLCSPHPCSLPPQGWQIRLHISASYLSGQIFKQKTLLHLLSSWWSSSREVRAIATFSQKEVQQRRSRCRDTYLKGSAAATPPLIREVGNQRRSLRRFTILEGGPVTSRRPAVPTPILKEAHHRWRLRRRAANTEGSKCMQRHTPR